MDNLLKLEPYFTLEDTPAEIGFNGATRSNVISYSIAKNTITKVLDCMDHTFVYI